MTNKQIADEIRKEVERAFCVDEYPWTYEIGDGIVNTYLYQDEWFEGSVNLAYLFMLLVADVIESET